MDEYNAMRNEIRRLHSVCEKYRNMLEDVVNELDLSETMIERHGPMGTEPSKLVRLVLDQKNLIIKAFFAKFNLKRR